MTFPPYAVLGIDASSKKLAAVITAQAGSPTLWKRTLIGDDIEARCLAGFKWAKWLMADIARPYRQANVPMPTVYAFLEEPVVVPRNIRSTMVQAKVHGAIVAGLKSSVNRVGPVATVVPPSWKKDVVGKGNATKQEIAAFVATHWPYLYEVADKDQDLLDAACINIYGQHHVRRVAIPEYRQQEAG